MINLSNITAGLVLGLIVTSAAPSFAASGSAESGREARAQAIEQGSNGDGLVSPKRAHALRYCNEKSGKLTDYTWGVTEIETYRSCMAGQGEIE